MENKRNILVIGGPAAENMAIQAYPDENLDIISGIKPQNGKRDFYDEIICYHTLQLVRVREIMDYLGSLHKCLKTKGVLNLFVPSLEWVADQLVYEEEPSPLILVHLFGNQQSKKDTHYSAHTLRTLRQSLSVAGFGVTHADYGIYNLEFQFEDGVPQVADVGQHIVIAYKREEANNETVQG